MDPVGVAMSKFWPAPTSDGNPLTGVNNYVHTDGDRTRKDTFSPSTFRAGVDERCYQH